MTGRSASLAVTISVILAQGLSACATSKGDRADQLQAAESAAKIGAGLRRLGASPERSDCFAEKIAAALGVLEAAEAVEIIETSLSRDEMRDGVLGASAPVKQSFIRAHMGCSFFQ